jgi:hypothetical protein
MKYYIDTEFLEGTQSKKLLGITYGQTKPTIDLISIGIVAEDGREYYAISKDFNLKEAWNRFEIKKTSPAKKYIGIFEEKVYWIRENVLKPIMVELQVQYNKDTGKSKTGWKFKDFKYLINKYGKTNKQIALEIKEFIGTKETIGNWEQVKDKMNTQFYAYYGAFDYVAFSQIFGGFEGYPESFPQYFIDLKQELDIKASAITNDQMKEWHHYPKNANIKDPTFDEKLSFIRRMPKYPQEPTTHHALSDAHWNKQLYEFINKI